MRNELNSTGLQISVYKANDAGKLKVEISSDYDGYHKSQLHVNEKRFSDKVEILWKSIKTKKLLSLYTFFSQIDWYDSEVDVYKTPQFSIKRGLKKTRIQYDTHGDIPKDWTINIVAYIAPTSTITPIIEVIKATCGSKFTAQIEKEFTKSLRLVLQGKSKYANYYSDND